MEMCPIIAFFNPPTRAPKLQLESSVSGLSDLVDALNPLASFISRHLRWLLWYIQNRPPIIPISRFFDHLPKRPHLPLERRSRS